MKFSEFLKTFKGNLVSVRDYRMSYCRYQWLSSLTKNGCI